MESKLKVGCCGYPIAREKYYKNFDCIEINITFYQMPELKTAEKWKKEAPKGFEFIIKAWQLITHPSNSFTYRRLREKFSKNKKKNFGFFKPTKEVFEAWRRTKEFAEKLGCKKILFQSPASFRPIDENKKNLKRFFNLITKSPNRLITFIWEPRGDWQADEIKKICKDSNLVHCVDPTISKSVYGSFNYFRLHGTYTEGRIDYNYQFSDKELKNIFSNCNKHLNYVMFNNATMFEDAIRFKKLA